MSDLKPCPFCGGEAIVVKTESCGRYIGCWDCGGRTEEFETDYAGSAHDKAISAWNRRADDERLKNALKEIVQLACENVERENPQPLTEYQFEKICESVHNGWWEEKKTQGITNHPDMIPYSELAESVKDYDRVTVRRVLDALGIVYGNPPKEVQA